MSSIAITTFVAVSLGLIASHLAQTPEDAMRGGPSQLRAEAAALRDRAFAPMPRAVCGPISGR